MSEPYLFDPQLLKIPTFPSTLTLTLRPLQLGDFKRGYCSLLGQLTQVGEVTEKLFQQRFNEWRSSGVYYVVVVENEEKIVSTGTLFIEKKLIHCGGLVGHIEEVVVDDCLRGQQLGKVLISVLLSLGDSLGCYKVLLNCLEKNVSFYEKCGFERREVTMAKYFKNRL
eukprot:TRINITY_DN13971_c0_g1_i1.p1 TRINITY_DN13971_c0_g1~~TRINITY_DN13971_c0_g1_i1.p1  ORF type:complete len:168 (+),score=37.34 TRINITY_DN13971_c0_g1_i1:111-614(+)